LDPPNSATRNRTGSAVLYVDPGSRQALPFAFQAGDPSRSATLKLPGLQPGVSYRVIWPEGFRELRIFTGRQLSDQGLTVTFPHIGSSAIILIQPVPPSKFLAPAAPLPNIAVPWSRNPKTNSSPPAAPSSAPALDWMASFLPF